MARVAFAIFLFILQQSHWNQLVTPSPWPLVIANSLFFVTSGLIFWMQFLPHVNVLNKGSFININYCFLVRDIIEKQHIY